jgi:MFS family permease
VAAALAEADARAYQANIRKFYLFRWLVNFQLFLPIWVVYLTDHRGLSFTEVTVLDAAFWVVLVLMEVPTGAIADRWGRKVSLMWGALANAIAIAVFAIAASYGVILISYLAWGVAWTLFSGADTAFFYDSLRAVKREGDYQRLYGRCWAIQQTGVLGGLLLGAPLAAWTSLPFPILVNAGIMGLAFLITLSFKEPPRHTEGETQLGYVANTKMAFRIVWNNQAIRYAMFFGAVVVSIAMCVSILLQPFLGYHGVALQHFGWFAMPGNLLAMGAALVAYRVTARFGVNRVLAFLPLLTMTAATGLGAWNSPYAFVFYPMNAVVWAMAFPLLTDFLNKRIPGGQRATILSIFQLLYSLVLVPYEPLFGYMADHGGLQAAYRLAAISVAVGAGPLLLLWFRALRREQRERAQAALPEGAPGA